ncbi:hypothetical protein J2Z82_001912 [Virgibacillus litoralis]|uniref:Uncharacterized protein n=1 Tax=Virgibacillus litoralis TaxID=578221 RepID=A0ABS4HDH7_9BACI|nr:hypothetical protein [Virgibacillus litoralis]
MVGVLKGFVKFFVSNLAVVLAIMLLPIFLITDSVTFFDDIMNYLFNNKKS